MKVILFYEHISREAEELKKIAKYLRENGVEVKIFSIGFQYASAVWFAKKNCVDVVVVPWMHHDVNYELMAPFIKYNRSVKIINLHHEEIAAPYSIPLLLPYGENARNSVIHFVWGQYFADELVSLGISKNQIYITGNGRTDFIYHTALTREQVAIQYNLDINKKWILFSENRGWALNWTPKMTQERENHGVPSEDTEELVKFTKESLKASEEDFATISKSFFEKYEFIYRPHPGTLPMDRLPAKIKVISDLSIYEWLKVVDANVVWSSTTVFESDAMGVPSIVYEPVEDIEKYRTFGIDNYYCIYSINDINEHTLETAIRVQQNRKIYEKYLGIIDGERCRSIAEKIMAIQVSIGNQYCAKPSRISVKRLIRMNLFETATYIGAKLNLINLLKFPHTAYLEYRDIPWIFDKDLK